LVTEQADPVSKQWIGFDKILEFKKQSGLKIVGVGYTMYLGSEHEAEMLSELAELIYNAHQNGMLVVVWMYPRGKAVKNEKDIHLIAGGAGVAACLGADFVKVNYPYSDEEKNSKIARRFKEVVRAGGRTQVICVGGSKMGAQKFLADINDQLIISCTSGNAVGRNIYQRELSEAVRMANAIAGIIYYDFSVEEAYGVFKGEVKLK